MEVAGLDFLLGVVFEDTDIVVLAASVVEDSACVELEEAFSADIVGGHVFVHDDELEDGSVSGSGGEGEGFVPCDGFFFISFDDFGLELGELSGSVVGFDLDVVFHFAEPVLALLEDGVSDGDFDLGHI